MREIEEMRMLALQNVILKMVASGETLERTLENLCLEVEALAPGIVCSVLTLDDKGLLHPIAGPSLPQHYSAALEGIAIGPDVGSCGTAAYLGAAVAVDDIENDPRWAEYKALALPLGLMACWSSPIFSNTGEVMGTFAFYFREKRGPTRFEESIVEACLPLCMIAMERQEQLLQHRRLAFVDALTGLPNRAKFNDDLRALADNSWSLLILDIDNLKTVNDTFGHAAGDEFIAAVASRLEAVPDQQDVYRLGGDEFAVIIRNGSASRTAHVAEKILDAVKAPAACSGHTVYPSVTIGGAEKTPGLTAESVRQNADFALYHAKETGRGRFVAYDDRLGSAISKRYEAIRDVALALDEDRIEAYYQPVVRLDTGEIVGVEALCRMRAGDGSLVEASKFHEATKDGRVASALTERMIMRVSRDVRRWLDHGIPFQHVGINIAAADFQSGGLSELLSNAFEKAGVPLAHAILEVTELVYLGHRDRTVANEIKSLREKGLKVALDDFGTGFASLTHLLTVPVDIIKIDKSFVDRLGPNDVGAGIVEGILHIAKSLGVRVVAEGIETADQAARLQAMGCLLGQGYLYSRAVSAEKMTRMLLEQGQTDRSNGIAKTLAS
jgi:diguanylate cyclase (GGDEF)-like protein